VIRTLICLLLLSSSSVAETQEVPVLRIPLDGKLREPGAEISGMAWWQDQLILLPQFGLRHFFALQRADIERYIRDPDTRPLPDRQVPIETDDLPSHFPGFEGYEAIAFAGDRCFVAIECERNCTMQSFIVAGELSKSGEAIRLWPERRIALPLGATPCNSAVEALTIVDGRLLAIRESNGANQTPEPTAFLVDFDLSSVEPIPFPRVEYRITDATACDAEGRFWVSNYLWPGDLVLTPPAVDTIQERCPPGASHRSLPMVERLLPLQWRDGKVETREDCPIWLELAPPEGRNWEAIAPLGDQGFLLMTDMHPESIFGFAGRKPRAATR